MSDNGYNGTSPSAISSAGRLRSILRLMSSSPQLHANTRIPRFRLTETTPAVLRFENGLRVAGELHVISRNGGLLLLPVPARKGSVVGLMFHTHRGPVVGTVQMLLPITTHSSLSGSLRCPKAISVHCRRRSSAASTATLIKKSGLRNSGPQ